MTSPATLLALAGALLCCTACAETVPNRATAPQAAPVHRDVFYTAFFALGSMELSSRALDVIDEFMRDPGKDTWEHVVVSGHADRAESSLQPQDLSRRRAEAVADELVRRGIPQDRIRIRAFGNQHLLVPDMNSKTRFINRRVELTHA